jgi:hypothetical protein
VGDLSRLWRLGWVFGWLEFIRGLSAKVSVEPTVAGEGLLLSHDLGW